MKIKSIIILTLLVLMSLAKANAQINYDLRLEKCIASDTLYINVLVDNNGDPLTFANANFAFDIYQGGTIGDTTGLLFSSKFIEKEGPWSAAGGNAPDYREMSLGSDVPSFPFFNLSINVDQTIGNVGYTLPSNATDTIGVIAVPLTGNWCGDSIELVWRDVNNTTWPGHPFQKGDILEWNSPTFLSIYNDANFINPNTFILCEGCGNSALSYQINPVNPTSCVGDTIDFFLTPTPNTGDTITFFVDGVQVQQSQDTLYRGVFNVDAQVHAVVGNPTCLACGTTSDTTNVTIGNAIDFALDLVYTCDSLTATVEDNWQKYYWYKNSVLIDSTFTPISSYTFNVNLNLHVIFNSF
mgnify:CR=1 FL=1